MSLKNWFGFLVSPENLTPTPVLICICITVVSVPILLVVIVTYKCKQKKNRGSKHENKTLSSGKTENDNKHSKVRKAQSQKDEGHVKQEVEKKVKAETLKANEIEGNESETQSQDVKAEVRMVEDQNERNENLQTPNKDLKTDNAELQLSKSGDLKKTKPEPEKQSVEISTPKEELEKNEVMTPDMLKKKQKTSSLKLDLAVTRRNKLEDTVDQFFSGKNQSMENELDNLKRTLHAREKELERFKWLRNYLIYEIPESFSQLKFKLAISRVQKLEDKVKELLHGKDQSNEKDLQILKWKLEAKEKEAAALKLTDEHQTEEGDEKNLQTLENNSPNHVVDEEVAVAQQQLQGEEQHSGNDELDKTEVMTPDMLKEKQEASSQLNLGLAVTTRNKLEIKVSELQQQLKDEQQSREKAEKDVQTLKDELENKNKELQESKCQFESLTEVSQKSERQLSELKERYKEEFKKKIRGEQQRRKEVEEDIKALKQELENKINQKILS
ncbi:myosin-2 heavy chain-like isoform X2 [Astatotilapia calliptera]|uniref:myosin-2 heavy chain-like isoform X2 n=2 Tax=Astatotilapia calliptera TaxID=8154 RepID=UPI000E41C433|nr:myosin-2 heavy chain-like isoform X2 [Astatotilapia calliptera]